MEEANVAEKYREVPEVLSGESSANGTPTDIKSSDDFPTSGATEQERDEARVGIALATLDGPCPLTLGGKLLSSMRSGSFNIISEMRETTLKPFDLMPRTHQMSLDANSARISLDGQMCLISDASTEKTYISSVQEGALINVVDGTLARYSDDGREMATADNTVLLTYEMPSLRTKREVELPCRILSLCFTPNGQNIFCGMANGQILEISTSSGSLRNAIHAHSSGVKLLVICPRSEILISVPILGSCCAWNLDTGGPIATLPRPETSVIAAIEVDVRLVAFVERRAIRIWDFSHQECSREFVFEGTTRFVAAQPVLRSLFVVVSDSSEVHLVDAEAPNWAPKTFHSEFEPPEILSNMSKKQMLAVRKNGAFSWYTFF